MHLTPTLTPTVLLRQSLNSAAEVGQFGRVKPRHGCLEANPGLVGFQSKTAQIWASSCEVK